MKDLWWFVFCLAVLAFMCYLAVFWTSQVSSCWYDGGTWVPNAWPDKCIEGVN